MDFPPFDLNPDDATVADPRHRPFYLPVPDSAVAALLIHGFTGSPWEMREPARRLAEAGIASLALRLPGHGTSPEDLARCRYEQWLDTVQKGQLLLQSQYRAVVAIGLSTGAMLALAAQAKKPFSRLALLAPYLAFRNRLASWAWLLRYFIHYQQRALTPAAEGIYYARRPITGIYQLNRLRNHVAGLLPDIDVPSLVVCADGDQTVDPASSVRLYQRLGSRQKQLRRFDRDVPHVLTTAENPQLDATLQLLVDFTAAATTHHPE